MIADFCARRPGNAVRIWHGVYWGISVVSNLRLLAVILGITGQSVTASGSTEFMQAALPSPDLGLFDSAGYPYYPIETQIFGAMRAHRQTLSVAAVPRESLTVPKSGVAKAPRQPINRAPIRLGFGDALQDPVQVSRSRTSSGPVPLPNTTIMDPWTIGVFR